MTDLYNPIDKYQRLFEYVRFDNIYYLNLIVRIYV